MNIIQADFDDQTAFAEQVWTVNGDGTIRIEASPGTEPTVLHLNDQEEDQNGEEEEESIPQVSVLIIYSISLKIRILFRVLNGLHNIMKAILFSNSHYPTPFQCAGSSTSITERRDSNVSTIMDPDMVRIIIRGVVQS